MFIRPEYDCITLQEMHIELKRTPQFKLKYPWIKELINNVTAQGMQAYQEEEFIEKEKLVNALLELKTNEKTGRFFNLSRPDKLVVTYAVTHKCKITTCDRPLADFAMQEFEIENITALGLLNHWIENKILIIDESKRLIIEQWDAQNEPVQPDEEKLRFKELTGFDYPGP
jgi:hypothetical protein